MSDPMDFTELKKHFDLMVKNGQLSAVRDGLARLELAKIPRAHLADFSSIARRARLLDVSLKLLHPVVHPENAAAEIATELEVASYATTLGATGCLTDAHKILLPLALSENPPVLLARSFLHIRAWDYAHAVTDLTRYLRCTGLSPYQFCVARLNLTAAYNFLDQPAEAIAHATEVLSASNAGGWTLLKRDALLLRGQAHMTLGNWADARRDFVECRNISATNDIDLLLPEKWLLLLDLREKGHTERRRGELAGLKKRAFDGKRWEVVRDIEYFEAVNLRDRDLLYRVYFGTRATAFRERVRKETGRSKFPPKHLWLPQGEAARDTIDLATGQATAGASLQGKPLLLRALRAISSDFYRPSPLGFLFSELYPNEFYDPFSSPQRVITAISRLNAWFKENSIPLAVHSSAKQFRLESLEPYGVLVRLKYRAAEAADDASSKYKMFVKKLKARWQYRAFSSRQAADLLEISVDEVKPALAIAVGQGRLYRSGSGRSTLFRFQK
jgi:tetratricopeptide (TPR) repeat protein